MIQQSKRMFTGGASAGMGGGSGMRARRGNVPTANEQYAIDGRQNYRVASASRYRESRQRHDARSIASTRSAARRLIEGDIDVDPAKVRIDQLPCVSSPFPGFSCDHIVQWYRSGGMRS